MSQNVLLAGLGKDSVLFCHSAEEQSLSGDQFDRTEDSLCCDFSLKYWCYVCWRHWEQH